MSSRNWSGMKGRSSSGERRREDDGRYVKKHLDDHKSDKRGSSTSTSSTRSARARARSGRARETHELFPHARTSGTSSSEAKDRDRVPPLDGLDEAEDMYFGKCKRELNKIFIATPNLVHDVVDFWKFVEKYESVTVEKRVGDGDDDAVADFARNRNAIGLPEKYRKSHCLNLKLALSYGDAFAGIPETKSSLTDARLLKFRDVILLYLDFEQKEKFAKLKRLRDAQANLPVARYKEDIIEMVKMEKVIIVAGDTGCGKSTQIPRYLYEAGFRKIACAQPRRIACVSLAKRVAFETLSENLSRVGYQIRFEKQRNRETNVTFITEGLLLRQVSDESTLSAYDAIVLDEVHERHLHGDLLLGIMKCIVNQKPDLKLVLMSATINIQLFSNYFAKENVKIIEVPGRLYPIQLFYRPVTVEDLGYKNDRFNPSPYVQIMQIIDQKYPVDEKGDLLIFLSGISEITAVVDAAKEYSIKKNNWIVLPLHSTLSIVEQDKVFDYAPDGVRKCIVATNIAETSITIDGIRFVADSGKVKEMSYDPSCKMQRLKEFWISKASAEQRKGRAGRTGPGVCYRIYSEEEYKTLEKYSTPELQRVPLDSSLLQMIAMGLPDARKFPFIEPPPADSLENAILSLKDHDALTANEKITCIGKTLARLPVDIAIGKMLIMGSIFHQVEPVLSVAAALSVQTPFTNRAYRDTECETSRKKLESDHGDPITLLNAFKEWLEVKRETSQEYRSSTNSSRKWCGRRGLEEQRFYEMTKLRAQFKDLLQDCTLLKSLPEPTSSMTSAERAIRHGELKFLKSLKRTYKQSEPKRRKQLKVETFDVHVEDNDEDNGELDIKDIEFRMRNDSSQVRNLLTASTACSYKDLTMLKLILCSGLYPQFACADEFNYCKSISEQLFHTKAKPYVALHPMSFFGNHPQVLQIDEADITPMPGFKSKTPVSSKHQILAYLSLLETTKPYLVNTLRMPAAQTLLLFAHEIDTNSTFSIIACDSWLMLEFPVPDSGQVLLLKAAKLRNKWDFLLNQQLQDFKKPDKNVVGETFAKDLTDWLFTGCWGGNNNQPYKCSPYRTASTIEYPGYDGWYNNVGRPELGAVDTPLLRRLPAAYEDGVYKPSGSKRPEPLEISEKLLSGKIGSKSRTGRNALLVFFGQQVVEEILDAQRPACPPEYINIKIPKNHRYRINKPGHTEMPVLRTRYDHRTGHSPNNPRQQLNEITPFLDGGLIYGTSKAWSDVLRTNTGGILQEDGQLASSAFPLYPDYNTVRLPMANPPPPIHHHQYVSRHYTESVTRYFKLGNPRGNENPFLLTFGIIWFRWHNFVASHIKRLNPKWSSDKVYNEARKWVIAVQQHIVVNEWLPSWLDDRLPAYEGYNPTIDPQIDQFFQSAAFRFGHTLVPPGVYLRNYGRNNCSLESHPIRTCNNYWMSQNSLHANLTRIKDVIDVEKLLMGMAIQLCEEEDHKIVEDLRGSLFGPLEFSRRDLMALNIQRGRDHGVPDYNSARRAYGLAEVKNVSHFNRVNVTVREEFLRLYNNSFDDVDVWVGGILETGDGPGELFQRIIRDQFQRIRDGDRFWYNNTANRLFTDKEVERLEHVSFYDVLMCTTKMDWNDIPKNPFRVPTTANDIHPSCINNKIVKEGRCTNGPCFHADQIDDDTIETCTELGTYDFFSNSGISFIFTFLGVSTLFCGFITLIGFKIQFKDKKSAKENVMHRKVDHSDNIGIIHTASEWQEPRASLRCVILVPNVRENQLEVKNQLGHLIRAVDFPSNSTVTIYCASDSHYMLIPVHHSYDLVLKFDSDFLRTAFIKAFEKFISEISTSGDASLEQMITNTTHAALLKQAITKKHRQKKLEMFFRVVFAQAFHIAHTEEEILKIGSKEAQEVIYTELTIIEFAEALSMRPDAEFVKKIFHLVDKDRNGFISFREFVDMLVIFLKGSAEEKMKLMFDMYNIDNTGRLHREEFSNMLRSFMETVNADVTDDELEALVQSMMYHADLATKEWITLQDFQQILNDFNDKFNYAELEFNVPTDGKSNRKLHAGVKTVRSTFIGEVQKAVESLYADPSELQSRVEGKVESVERDAKEEKSTSVIIDKDENIVEEMERHSDDYWYPIMKYLANKRLQIFWACLYTLFLLGIFAERVYYYSVQREHSGLRRILGYGLTITRGAASAMMFTYSTLLIMMCHNTITILRTTTLHVYIPFDSAIEMHKYIACWALVFTALHTIGHGFNFYHISTQTADDLTCLFRNYFHATHELPKFHYWCWGTMTGITGIFLTILTGVIFVCSLPMVRKSFYNWFSFVHSLYPAFYILMILHGSGRLVQEPYFHYFFLGPAILFILDKVVTVTRTTTEIPILKAEILPSGVTCITFLRPLNFQYKSGQWIRIACPALQTNEYHPFTLSSAPHETNLSIHVRAVGPWTTNIREKLDLCAMSNENLPMIHIDGPYGEGHQDWDKYQVAIMVGGGIGVTPFASILKDIVFKSTCKLNFGCKKVYFLWVTRTQKQFEWMVDILRELEKVDVNKTVTTHIFVTQFYQKFDLRTILLYICERHFQKISTKSLFTGLKAVTHFGRPKFSQFFLSIQKLHPTANKIGVFSCGTPAVTQAVDAACKAINLTEINDTLFQHHYKSF